MNKYIKSDIEQAMSFLTVAINNALNDIETGEETNIRLGNHVPFSLVVELAEKRGWEPWSDTLDEDFFTNGWESDCWYDMRLPNSDIKVVISGSLWCGQKTTISIAEDEEN